ncbi:MAG: flagellar filament capping protein FliD [Sedimentisphaerales bacterium]|nr:flagellar filament capping protein FliD [Sedimentisphaerales bacterium]
MSSIQLSGLATGIDTATLIEQLMLVERQRLTMYETRKETCDEKKSVLTEIQSKLSSLSSAVGALSDANKLKAFNVSSSDEDKITAEATSNAFEGNHTIVVNQLAAAERWVHTSGLEYAEDLVGEGTFIYSYNHKETIIETTADTTLEELVGLINNDAENPGVTASLLHYNDAYHLVLNGNDAGTDYELNINSSNTEVWQMDWAFEVSGANATLNSNITELDQFSGTLGTGDMITITGTDKSGAAITPVNLTVNSNTRIENLIGEINDAFDGIAKAVFENGKIILTDDTPGTSGISIDLDFTSSTAVLTLPTETSDWDVTEGGTTDADLTGYTEADFTETQQARDSQIKVDGFPPGESDWITRSSNTIDDVISGITLHIHNTTDASGEEINLTRNVESVKEKIEKFVEAYNGAIAYIKEQTRYDRDADEAGILIGDYIISNIRDQLRIPLYTQTDGFVEDIDTFLNPAHIGLELDSDGLLSFDADDFDEAIGKDYLGVLSIIGADKTGSSDSANVRFYGSSSDYTAGGSYRVRVTYDGSGNLSEAYFKLSSESDSAYRTATISGNVITGNSSFDDNGNPVYGENSLQVTAPLTGTPGSTIYATIRVKQGFAGAIEDSLDDILKATTGSLKIDIDTIDDRIEALQDKIDHEEGRLEKKKQRLTEKFARLEKMLTLMQSQLYALNAYME